MSHRIWWLVSFCALAIGAAIEFDLNPTAPQAAAQADPPAAVAARKSASPGG